MGVDYRATSFCREQKRTQRSFFEEIVTSKVREDFAEEMYELGFSEQQIEDFKKHLSRLPLETQCRALSIPLEVRGKQLIKYKNELGAGADIGVIVNRMIIFAEKEGFGLGYHLSKTMIHPNVSSEGTAWEVVGDEFDERENLTMAYYSLDYQNLYREKPSRYLYVVRIGNTMHHFDPTHHWGRAPHLSVIGRYEINSIDNEIQAKVASLKEHLDEQKKGRLGLFCFYRDNCFTWLES